MEKPNEYTTTTAGASKLPYWKKTQDDYRDYLASDEWEQRKRKRLAIDHHRCQMCGCAGTQMNPLNVHHLTYHNIRHEDVEKDLVTLCRSCHLGVHSMMNRCTNAATGQRGWKDQLSVSMVSLEREQIQRRIAEGAR